MSKKQITHQCFVSRDALLHLIPTRAATCTKFVQSLALESYGLTNIRACWRSNVTLVALRSSPGPESTPVVGFSQITIQYASQKEGRASGEACPRKIQVQPEGEPRFDCYLLLLSWAMSISQAYRSWVYLLSNCLLCGLSITPALLVYMILTIMMQMGIVGLPNVGKSTLFNTLGKVSIPAENFPFCTIEPNNVSSMMHSTCICPELASGFQSNQCAFATLLTLYALQHNLW